MWNSSLSNFIMQDVQNLLGRFTKVAGDIAQRVTDVVGKVTHALGGRKRKRVRKARKLIKHTKSKRVKSKRN